MIIGVLLVFDKILIWYVSFPDGVVVVVLSFILKLIFLIDLQVLDWVV